MIDLSMSFSSPQKAARKSEMKRQNNRILKGKMKSLLQNAFLYIKEGNKKAEEVVKLAQSQMRRAVKNNIIHINKYNRKVSQLHKALFSK